MIELTFPKELITAEINDRLEIHKGWNASMFNASVRNIVRDIQLNNKFTSEWMSKPEGWKKKHPLHDFLRNKRTNCTNDVGFYDTLNSIFHSIYCTYLHAFRMSYLGYREWVWMRDTTDPANYESNSMLNSIPESFIIEAQKEAIKYADGFFKARYGMVCSELVNDAKSAIAKAHSENPMRFK